MKNVILIVFMCFSMNFIQAQENYTLLSDFSGIGIRNLPNQDASNLITDGTYMYGYTNKSTVGNGTIFKIKISDGMCSIIHYFPSGVNVGTPTGPIVLRDDYIYGIVGNNIYKIKTDGTLYSIVFVEARASLTGGLSLDNSYMYATFSSYVGRIVYNSNVAILGERTLNNYDHASAVLRIGNEIYGTSSNNKGRVFKTPYDFPWRGDVSTTLVTFDGINKGELPYGKLFYDGEFLYGTTQLGGDYSVGVLYKVKPDGSEFLKIHNCEAATGSNPSCSLISDGTYLYGTANAGGTNNKGVIYKIKHDGTDYTVLYQFAGSDGANPQSALVLTGGYLWGTTSTGTADNYGGCFKIATDGTGFTNIVNFTNNKGGKNPDASVIKIGSSLYGTNLSAVNSILSVIYKIDLDNNSLTSTLYNLPNNIVHNRFGDGHGGTSFVYDGTYLYGLGNYTKNVLYKIKPDGTSYSELYNFTSPFYLMNSLHLEGNVIYGTTYTGGTYNSGVLYKMNTDGTGFTIIHNFTGDDEQSSPLVSDGTYLYGSVQWGDPSYNYIGIIYRIKMSDDSYEEIYKFPAGSPKPSMPEGLTITGGYLYVICHDGTNAVGALVRINLSNFESQTLYNFNTADGSKPTGSLATDGTFLYGLTSEGGANNKGVAFKYHIASGRYIKMFDFNGANGAGPRSIDALFLDGTNIYGTAFSGGYSNYGTVFKYEITPETFISIATQGVSNQTQTTATATGNISDLGLSNPTQHGFCWSTSEKPTIADSKVELGEATAAGVFSSAITGLSLGTTYYIRAYATNATGTKYGEQIAFTTTLFYGSGTAIDPYQIRDYADLRRLSFAQSVWGSGFYFIQTANIDATPSQAGRLSNTYMSAIGFNSDYLVITPVIFKGNYDGNYHLISNLAVGDKGLDYQGLFGCAENATITNLGIVNAVITGNENVGGLVGAMNGGTLSNCFFTGSVSGKIVISSPCVGGFVGNARCNITNCYAIATVTGDANVGGFVSKRNGIITNCYSAGTVTGTTNPQPFIAINDGGSTANSFWDVEVDGIDGNISGADNFGATGKSTSEMKTQTTFTNATWDFEGETTNGTSDYWKWDGLNNQSYPYFSWQVFTYAWNGTGTWDVTANWDKGAIPVSNSNIIVNSGELIINQNVSVTNLTINPNAKLTLNSGYGLTVNGNLTIKSDVAGTGSFVDNNGTLTVSGTTTVERYAVQNRTLYFSSAVSNAKSNTFAGALGLYKFNAAAGTPAWAAVTIDDVNILTSGNGFAVKYTDNAPDIKFIGNLNTGEVSPAISHNILGYNWNLVGNPYPSAVDWDAVGWTKTGINDAIYLRTGANTVATYSGGVGTNNGSRYIATGQGFWVRTISNSPVLIFTNPVRVHNPVSLLKGVNANILRLNVDAENYSDEIAIAMNDNAMNGIDDLDAYKMFSNGSSPELYSLVENKEMVINQLSASNLPSQVNLGLKSNSIETYKLRVNLSEFGDYSGAIILIDHLLNKRIDLRINPTYTFTSAVGSVNNRFAIEFTKNATGITEAKAFKTQIFATQNQIHVRFTEATSAQVEVVDLLGRILISKKVNNKDNTLSSNGLSGIYLVSVKTEKGSITEKVLLQ